MLYDIIGPLPYPNNRWKRLLPTHDHFDDQERVSQKDSNREHPESNNAIITLT